MFFSFDMISANMLLVSFMFVVPFSSSVVYGLLFLLEIVLRLFLPSLLVIASLVVVPFTGRRCR